MIFYVLGINMVCMLIVFLLFTITCYKAKWLSLDTLRKQVAYAITEKGGLGEQIMFVFVHSSLFMSEEIGGVIETIFYLLLIYTNICLEKDI